MKRFAATIVALLMTLGLVGAIAPPAQAQTGYTNEPLVTTFCYDDNMLTNPDVWMILKASWNGNAPTTVARRDGRTPLAAGSEGCSNPAYPWPVSWSWVPTQPGTYTLTVCVEGLVLGKVVDAGCQPNSSTVVVTNRGSGSSTTMPPQGVPGAIEFIKLSKTKPVLTPNILISGRAAGEFVSIMVYGPKGYVCNFTVPIFDGKINEKGTVFPVLKGRAQCKGATYGEFTVSVTAYTQDHGHPSPTKSAHITVRPGVKCKSGSTIKIVDATKCPAGYKTV